MYYPSINLINPLPVSSQLSLSYPLVYVSTITFLMIFVLIYLRIKTRMPAKTRQTATTGDVNQ